MAKESYKKPKRDTMAHIQRRNTIREDLDRAFEINSVKDAIEKLHETMNRRMDAVMNFIKNGD